MENGVKCLYLNGSGEHATTPAVDFGQTSLTMASWVKLENPAQHPSTIYSYWTAQKHFLFDAYAHKKLRFKVKNNNGTTLPLISEG